MKRFLADAALIVVLVLIGSSLRSTPAAPVEERIDAFEQSLHTDVPWEEEEVNGFYAIEENKASSLALSMSRFIVAAVTTGTLAFTDFFTALLV